LTAALRILWLQLSPPSPSSFGEIKSKTDTFWYWLTQVHLEKNSHQNGKNRCVYDSI